MGVNEPKLSRYLADRKIFEFEEKELVDYVVYNCPEIPSEIDNIKAIKEYFGEYLFKLNNKYYQIDFDEALDIYE